MAQAIRLGHFFNDDSRFSEKRSVNLTLVKMKNDRFSFWRGLDDETQTYQPSQMAYQIDQSTSSGVIGNAI